MNKKAQIRGFCFAVFQHFRSAPASIARMACQWNSYFALVCAAQFCLVAEPVALAQNARPGGTNDASDVLFEKPRALAIRLQLSPASMGALGRNRREDVRATVWEGGEVFTDVAVHIKGQGGSVRPLNDRPALTLKFDKFKPGQQFHGLHKIHLNNSVQDDSLLNEIICGDLFRQAGVPTARGTHAQVTLNGRSLGVYVLKEGYDKRFLSRYFKNREGNLYDTAYRLDIDQPLTATTGTKPEDDTLLKAAVSAAMLPDKGRRIDALRQAVDLDEFLSFMAMEIITVHWDGYSMFKNNYKVYGDPASRHLYFFAHGMDMMFQRPECSILPGWDGLVAWGLMQTPEGKQLYLDRLRNLTARVFSVERVVQRIKALDQVIRPALMQSNPGAVDVHDTAVQTLIGNVEQRGESLKQQLADPEAFATGQHPLFPTMTRQAAPDVGVAPRLRTIVGLDRVPGPRMRPAQPRVVSRPPQQAQPQTVKADRTNRLPIQLAALHGSDIQLEGPAEAPNVGFWLNPEDYVEWSLLVRDPGTYRVSIVFASAPGTGGPFKVTSGNQHLTGETKSTGGYGSYEEMVVGSVKLSAGPADIMIKPNGKFVFGLMNLRSVKLVRIPETP